MKLEKDRLEKIILGVVIGVIVVVVLVFLILRPNLKRISSLRIKVNEEKQKVLSAEKEVKHLLKMKKNLQEAKGKIEKYQSEAPEATAYWLLGKLNQLAKQSGISFEKTEPRGFVMQIGDYKLQEIDIVFKTDYHQLGTFINQLENISPFIVVRDIKISQNADDFKKHNVSLSVGTFVFIPEEENK